VTVYLVRHADAGNRTQWSELDRVRPLSESGWRQAESLVSLFADATLSRVLTSSYLRCRQTVEPLARARRLTLEYDDRLIEGADTGAAWELISGVGDGSVLCSHGDVVSAVVIHLDRAGIPLEGGRRWEKCSIWALEVDGGTVHRGRYIPPPL